MIYLIMGLKHISKYLSVYYLHKINIANFIVRNFFFLAGHLVVFAVGYERKYTENIRFCIRNKCSL